MPTGLPTSEIAAAGERIDFLGGDATLMTQLDEFAILSPRYLSISVCTCCIVTLFGRVSIAEKLEPVSCWHLTNALLTYFCRMAPDRDTIPPAFHRHSPAAHEEQAAELHGVSCPLQLSGANSNIKTVRCPDTY